MSEQSFRVEEASIDDIQAAIRDGRTTCVEIVQQYVARVRAFNGVGTALVTEDGGPVPPEQGIVRGGESGLPRVADDDFEALVAQRSLLMLNDLLATTNADHRRLVPRYAANTALKIRSWLDDGTFRHDIDGVLPLD